MQHCMGKESDWLPADASKPTDRYRLLAAWAAGSLNFNINEPELSQSIQSVPDLFGDG